MIPYSILMQLVSSGYLPRLLSMDVRLADIRVHCPARLLRKVRRHPCVIYFHNTAILSHGVLVVSGVRHAAFANDCTALRGLPSPPSEYELDC